MTVKVIIENAVVQKGSRKSDGKSFYFVEVMQPIRKYINPAHPSDAATLDALSETGQQIQDLVLAQNNTTLTFSSKDLKS